MPSRKRRKRRRGWVEEEWKVGGGDGGAAAGAGGACGGITLVVVVLVVVLVAVWFSSLTSLSAQIRYFDSLMITGFGVFCEALFTSLRGQDFHIMLIVTHKGAAITSWSWRRSRMQELRKIKQYR